MRLHYRKAKRVDTVNNFRRLEQMVPDDLLKYAITLHYTLFKCNTDGICPNSKKI